MYEDGSSLTKCIIFTADLIQYSGHLDRSIQAESRHLTREGSDGVAIKETGGSS